MQDTDGARISQASGFLVDETGLIATNYHVIKKGSRSYVLLADKSKLQVLGVAAMDEEADLAIIKVNGQYDGTSLDLATEEPPAVGSKVFTIGNPLGLAHTFSDGIVSGRREAGEVPGKEQAKFIQVTAPISPGSSGGPVLNSNAKVIGVATASSRTGQNLNLAVPVSYLERLLTRARSRTSLTRFPITEEPRVERTIAASVRSRPTNEWSQEDIENASHFVQALKAAEEAFAVGRRAGLGARFNPWRLAPNLKREFIYQMEKANREARLSAEVLRRMNPKLPEAWGDFVAGSYALVYGLNTNQNAAPGGQAAWEHWVAWSNYGMEQTHVPPGACD